jgi:hypothetical protein
MITTQQMPVALKKANSILKRRPTNRKTSLLIEQAEGRVKIPEVVPRLPSTPAALAKSRSASVSVVGSPGMSPVRRPGEGDGKVVSGTRADTRGRTVTTLGQNGHHILFLIFNRLTRSLRHLQPLLIVVLWFIAFKRRKT